MATVTQPDPSVEQTDPATRPSPSGADPQPGQTVLAWTALVLGLLVIPIAALSWFPAAIRLPVVLAFVCVAPGAAFVARVRMGDPVSSWAMAFVLSLALNATVASLMVWTGWWDSAGGLALLAVPTAAVAVTTIWPQWRRWLPRRAERGPADVPAAPAVSGTRSPGKTDADIGPSTAAAQDPVPGVEPRAAETGSLEHRDDAPAPGDGQGFLSRPSVEDADLLSTWLSVGREETWPASPDQRRDSERPATSAVGALHREPAEPGAAAIPWLSSGGRGDLSESIPAADDGTALLPRVPADDGTALLPRVPADDGTALLPRVPAAGGDGTMLLPRVPAAGGDGTMRLPRILAPRRSRPKPKGPTPATRAAARPTGRLSLVIGAVAVCAWVVSLLVSSVDELTTYGLVAAMGPLYVVAITFSALAFVIELQSPVWRGWVLLAHTAVLLLIVKATVPLMAAEPAYAWTYKHVGVVELFRVHGQITDGEDIYQQWPTFFALVAHVVDGTGVDALRLAAWAPTFFGAAFGFLLFAIARTLSTDPRVPYLATFIFTATNWVGQDYLAPQAFAFTLALGTLLLILRWLRRPAGSRGRRVRQIGRLRAAIAAGLPPVPYTSRRAATAATVAMTLVFLMVVASHQLTPYLVAMSATGLVVVGLVRSYRVIPILGGLALGYLLPRYDVVDNYGLFQGFNFFLNARSVGSSATDTASAGRLFNVNVTMVVALVVWGLAVLAVVSALRRLGPVAVPGLLAFAPFGLLLAQSYGGEAIFRVYLFSAPWCAILIAMLVLRRRWLPPVAGALAGAVALALTVLATMQASQGQAMTTIFTRDEVAMARYLYGHMEPGSILVLPVGNYPTRLTETYGEFEEYSLIGPNDRLGLYELSEAGVNAFDTRFDEDVANYMVFGPSMADYLEYFGYMPPSTLDALQQQVVRSPNWLEYVRIGEVVVYRRAPGQTVPLGPGGQVR